MSLPSSWWSFSYYNDILLLSTARKNSFINFINKCIILIGQHIINLPPLTIGRVHTIFSVSSCRRSELYLGVPVAFSMEQPPKISNLPSIVKVNVCPNREVGPNPLVFGWIHANESVLNIQRSLKVSFPSHPPWTTIFLPTNSEAKLNLNINEHNHLYITIIVIRN